MVSPTLNGFQHNAFVGERAVGIVARGVANVVGVARGIGKIVFAVVLMHPSGLKKTFVVVAFQESTAIFVHNFDVFHFLRKRFHIGAEFGHFWQQSLFIFFAQFAVGVIRSRCPALELSAPYSAKIKVVAAVAVFKNARVNAETAFDGLGFGLERSRWAFAGGHANSEHVLLVFGG